MPLHHRALLQGDEDTAVSNLTPESSSFFIAGMGIRREGEVLLGGATVFVLNVERWSSIDESIRVFKGTKVFINFSENAQRGLIPHAAIVYCRDEFSLKAILKLSACAVLKRNA